MLSGFLITSILLAEHRATGRIELWAFWVRRARRLFPALLALMPAIGLYATFVARPAELAGIRADAVATLAYVANWRAILSHRSYWELFLSPSPLEHTWSLAEMVCPKGERTREVNGVPLRPDGVHFDVVASAELGRRVLAVLDPVGEGAARTSAAVAVRR